MTRHRVGKALIPAAGRGTRFLPLTKAVPKELAPIVTTPAIELVVTEAARVGIDEVLFVVSPDKHGISEYFERDTELEAALEQKGDTTALELVRRAPQLATFSSVD